MLKALKSSPRADELGMMYALELLAEYEPGLFFDYLEEQLKDISQEVYLGSGMSLLLQY